jgi:hypothetical protein
MKALIDTVAEFIEGCATDQASPIIVQNFGFVELANRESRGKTTTSTQPIPVTITGTHEREQVSLNDEKDFIFWIRTVGRSVPVPSDDQWGIKTHRRLSLPIRIVIAHKVEFGENLVYQLLNDFPISFVVAGYEYMDLENIEVDPDHEVIHDTELGKTNYEKHRFPWNIYVINMNIEFAMCVDYVAQELITDEFGNCLFA